MKRSLWIMVIYGLHARVRVTSAAEVVLKSSNAKTALNHLMVKLVFKCMFSCDPRPRISEENSNFNCIEPIIDALKKVPGVRGQVETTPRIQR